MEDVVIVGGSFARLFVAPQPGLARSCVSIVDAGELCNTASNPAQGVPCFDVLTSVKSIGTWWAAVPQDRWLTHESARAHKASNWEEPWGDRSQEPVFIAAGIGRDALKATLESCLVPEDLAAGPDALPDMSDPFPAWRRAEEAA